MTLAVASAVTATLVVADECLWCAVLHAVRCVPGTASAERRAPSTKQLEIWNGGIFILTEFSTQPKYQKALTDHIEGETSFSYERILVGQATSWPQPRAKVCRCTMVGLGTAEEVYQAMCELPVSFRAHVEFKPCASPLPGVRFACVGASVRKKKKSNTILSSVFESIQSV